MHERAGLGKPSIRTELRAVFLLSGENNERAKQNKTTQKQK